MSKKNRKNKHKSKKSKVKNNKRILENQTKRINENKDSSYSNIYGISTFLISLFVFVVISIWDKNQYEDMTSFVTFVFSFPICLFFINKYKKDCEKTKGKKSKTLSILIDVGTNIGYLNPILLCFNAVSGLCDQAYLSVFFSIVIFILTVSAIVPVVKKYKNSKNDSKNFDIKPEEIKPIIPQKQRSYFRFIVFLFLLIITVLLLKICVNFNIFDFNLSFDGSLKEVINKFFKNDYVINILCTIITAVALYVLQIKYSKYKLKRDFRCNEIIHDLYSGIESAYKIRSNAKQIRIELDSLGDINFREKEKIKSKKYCDFYNANKADFHLSHLALTYHNNDILIDSIQTVFFLNLNFKLLNIVNNIKNRKPNLEKEYPKIESLYEKYEKEAKESDFLALGNEIEQYITDVGFMGEYCLDLLNYLGYDPIPNKLYISIFNSMYPSTDALIKYLRLPKKEQYKISKNVYIKSIVKFVEYKVKKFFE